MPRVRVAQTRPSAPSPVSEAAISNIRTLALRSLPGATGSPADHLATATGVDFEFSFAFQPIVDAVHQEIISFEALVRGPHGESSSEVFALVPPQSLQCFDQACRRKAIGLAARLNLKAGLNLNLVPNSSQRIR